MENLLKQLYHICETYGIRKLTLDILETDTVYTFVFIGNGECQFGRTGDILTNHVIS